MLCVGESLIDVVRRGDQVSEHVGGSPLNVAVGLARLGGSVTLASWWGRDAHGERIAQACAAAGVAVEPGSDGAGHTSVAQAELDDEGRATYTFDFAFSVPPIDDEASVRHVHTGSIACTAEAGGSQVVDLVERARAHATVSYDPNTRSSIMGSPGAVLDRIEALIGASDVVKASDEDIAWLYSDAPLTTVMRGWLDLGVRLVVVTRGPEGALAWLAGEDAPHDVERRRVDLADTVGAGDSFMAGLISGLLAAGLLGGADARGRLDTASWAEIEPALRRAVLTSATTVSHAGAYAPTLAEIAELDDADQA